MLFHFLQSIFWTTSSRRSAFTILEMLLVCGVIAILAVLLLPVWNSLQMKAQRAACAGNLRQLGSALSLYVGEHNGQFPPLVFPGDLNPLNPNGVGEQWDMQLFHYLYPGMSTSGKIKQPSTVFQCPAIEAYPLGVSRSYRYNDRLAKNVSDSGRATTLKQPHRVMTLIDGEYAVPLGGGKAHSMFFVYWSTTIRLPYEKHGGTVNVLFADGHVEAKPPVGDPDDSDYRNRHPRGVLFYNDQPLPPE